MRSSITICFFFIVYSLQAQITAVPDSTFHATGYLEIDQSETGHAIAMQSDFKIVVAGDDGNCRLVRLHPDGSIDSTFGTNGAVVWDRFGDDFTLAEMVIQDDGKIVVAGYTEWEEVFIVRFTQSGDMDTSFNGGYQWIWSDDYEYHYTYDVNLQPDGKIVTAGLLSTGGFGGSYADLFLIRLMPDGTFDNSFAGDGKLYMGNSTYDRVIARCIDVQPDGKLLVGGYHLNNSDKEYLRVWRLDSNGAIDTTFNETGTITLSINGKPCRVMDIAYTDYGKILCAGYAYKDTILFPFLLQLNPDGSMDNTFGTNGIWYTEHTTNMYFRKLAIKDERIYITGTIDSVQANNQLLLMCFNKYGEPDESFGAHGLMKATGSYKDHVGYDIIVQPDDRIAVCGSVSGGMGNPRMFAMRFLHQEIIDPQTIPDQTTLVNMYPNPVGTNTLNLQFDLAKADVLHIELYDMYGNRCAILLPSSAYDIGKYQFSVSLPPGLGSGQYVVRCIASEFSSSISLIVL